MSFITQEQNAAMVEAARMENAKKQIIEAVYADPKYREFMRCEANDRAIPAVIERWAGNSDVLPSKALFDEVMLENPEEINNFARQSLAVIREQLVSEILTLLRTHSRRDEFMLKQEAARLQHSSTSIEALRIRLSELKTKIRMNAEPVSVLKELVAAAHPVPGYPTLPRQLFENGATVAVNAAYIRALDTFSLKRMCRIYSTEAVNQRLAEG